MKNLKKILASALALSMAFSAVGCGSSDDSGKKTTTTESDEDYLKTYTTKVDIDTNSSALENIASLPGGEESTILYMGEADLNPTKSNPEMSVELKLFESKGGKIAYSRVTNAQRFDKLAEAIISQQNVPDIFKYEWLAFPAQIMQERYQPINDIVDFDSALWSDVKEAADQYCFKGDYYVAPLAFVPSAMIFYDKDIIESEGLDDPYNLYLNGEWDFNAMHSIMSEWVSGGDADNQRYGINGFFKPHIVQQTGQTMITKDGDKFYNNINNSDIEKVENFLYDITKENLVLGGWIGSARECFTNKCLFYGMGEWAATGNNQPNEGEHWGVVPMPQYPDNPQKITTSDMTAFMWIKGSKKADAVKCWFECYRASRTDPEYVEANKKTFFANNPNWTEEMYQVKVDIVGEDYLEIFDYGFGVSAALGDRNQFDGNQCLIDALYSDVTVLDEEGVQKSWTQVRDTYATIINSEVDALNQALENYKK